MENLKPQITIHTGESPTIGPDGKRKRPNAYPPTVREACRVAMEAGGLTYDDAAKRFEEYGVTNMVVRKWASRYKWKIPEGQKYESARHKRDLEVAKQAADLATHAIKETWSERGEAHRTEIFSMAKKLIKEAKEAKNLRIADVTDLDRVDKMARRAAGLEDGDGSKVQVAVNLALLDRD